MKHIYNFRIKLLGLGFFLFFFVIIAQLYIVQIVKGEEYGREANRQYIQPKNTFNRGNIFFEYKDDKKFSAGMTISGFKLTINPNLIENAEDVYEKLSNIIEIDKDIFLYRANKKGDPYEEIKDRLDFESAEKIRELDLIGVSLEMDKWRFYPGNNLASHTLGFVAYNGDSLEGIYGVEKYYDYLLQRESKNLFVNFFAEIFSNLNQVILEEGIKKEGDIIMTIEPSVQNYLENRLEELSDNWKTELAGGIIINPNNGEIYALGFSPTFDSNNFNKAEGIKFGNPMVENVYEMGSIIKALTVAIGLDTGAVSADTIYNDKGSITLDGKTISNYDGKARGVVELQQILNQSLNLGAVFVAQEIGNKKFAKYLFDLGLGEETGIDLPNETYGLLSNLESNRDIEYATASFGQGIAITPIGAVKALCTLANGGFLITPHLVKEIEYDIMPSEKLFYENERIFKEETSREISRMLSVVVDDALLGGTVKSDDYLIAAKTGTAQMVRENIGGYYENKYLHSFFGYFPASKPEFLVFLYIIDPKEVKYSSQTLTHPFMDIFRFLINYYEVIPDRENGREN